MSIEGILKTKHEYMLKTSTVGVSVILGLNYNQTPLK
jgi:hypothetical protein